MYHIEYLLNIKGAAQDAESAVRYGMWAAAWQLSAAEQVTVMGWPRAGCWAGLRQGLMNEMGTNWDLMLNLMERGKQTIVDLKDT